MKTIKTLLLFFAGVLAGQPAFAAISLKTDEIAGVTLYYKVITPKDYDPAREYPAVLAFPGGGQTMPMVDGMIARNLAVQAQKRGYGDLQPSKNEPKLPGWRIGGVVVTSPLLVESGFGCFLFLGYRFILWLSRG